MIQILVGTNRPTSRSLELANIIKEKFSVLSRDSEILKLENLPLSQMDGSVYSEAQPTALKVLCNKVTESEGLYIIVPEYNGSMPGILKYFIDHLPYPQAFLYRPVCFIGLGGMFGGLRPVEHCQQVFSYRNAFIYPDRLFLQNIWNMLKNGKLNDDKVMQLLKEQIEGFTKYIDALNTAQLSAKFRNQ